MILLVLVLVLLVNDRGDAAVGGGGVSVFGCGGIAVDVARLCGYKPWSVVVFIFTVLVAVVVVVVCVFIYSPVREGSTFFVITVFQLFRKELTPVRKVSADANLKRFQHKLL